MKWFKHDSDASIDAKMERLIMRYGLQGYGLYFYCLELIVASIEEHNLSFELEHDAEIIGHRTGTHPDQVQEMMRYMVDLGLFENSNGQITCYKIVKRLDSSMTSNPKLRQIIKGFHAKNHDGVMTVSGESHDSVMLEKKRTEEKRKGRFAPPTVKEIKERCNEMRYSVNPESFFNFYQSKNWMVGKNKMSDWKAALAQWNSRENKDKPKNKNPFAGGI
jgi:hypothetical protein